MRRSDSDKQGGSLNDLRYNLDIVSGCDKRDSRI